MGNKSLKEKVRKNVKERIAVSNIREEFALKNKKIIYVLTSACAVFVLGFSAIIGTSTLMDNKVQKEQYEIAGKNELNNKDSQSNQIKKEDIINIYNFAK